MTEHLVRSFEDELKQLRVRIREMGELAERQFRLACTALLHRDRGAAEATLSSDTRLDALQAEIAAAALRLLALRQPVAVDLREAIAAIRSTSDFERIGDLSKDLAKRTIALGDERDLRAVPSLESMAALVAENLHGVIEAYVAQDAGRALEVWRADAAVDDWFHSIYRQLLAQMLEDGNTINVCTHLLFAAKSLERIGDHCATIAASVYQLVEGTPLAGERPKGLDSVLKT